jgi:putative phage-type endonuclease
MKSQLYTSREEWLDARAGRITGSKLGSLIGKRDGKPKKGYYELIAERVALPPSGENAMDRGTRLEDEAVQRFAQEAGKKVNTDLVIWSRDDSDDIAVSPDGYITKKVKGKKEPVVSEAVECKCLNSASHIEAFVTREIPSDYEHQVLQYFIVNEDLEKLYFVFYDPRMPKDFFWIEKTRAELQADIDYYLDIERRVLAEVVNIEKLLTF